MNNPPPIPDTALPMKLKNMKKILSVIVKIRACNNNPITNKDNPINMSLFLYLAI
jgi:hypothetical protein